MQTEREKIQTQQNEEQEEEKDIDLTGPSTEEEKIAQYTRDVLQAYHHAVRFNNNYDRVCVELEATPNKERRHFKPINLSPMIQTLYYLRALANPAVGLSKDITHLAVSTLFSSQAPDNTRRLCFRWRGVRTVVSVHNMFVDSHVKCTDHDGAQTSVAVATAERTLEHIFDRAWDCPPWLHDVQSDLSKCSSSSNNIDTKNLVHDFAAYVPTNVPTATQEVFEYGYGFFVFRILKYFPRNTPRPDLWLRQPFIHPSVRTPGTYILERIVIFRWGNICLAFSAFGARLWKKTKDNSGPDFDLQTPPALELSFSQPNALQLLMLIGTQIRDYAVPPANDHNLRLYYAHHLPAVQSFLCCLETLRRRSGDNQGLPTELILHVLSFLSPVYDTFAL